MGVNQVSDLGHESVDDLIHAADRLHHHGRLVPGLVPIHDNLPQVRLEQLGKLPGVLQLRRYGVVGAHQASTLGALVGVDMVEVAEGAQEVDDALGFFFRDHIIQTTGADAFGGELREKATRVRHVLAISHGLAAKRRIVLYPGVAVLVDERRQRHSQLPAIVEQRRVMAGNAGRSHVEVEVGIGIELTGLWIADLVDQGAMAHRQVASARAVGGLEHGALVAFAVELIGCRQPCNAGRRE